MRTLLDRLKRSKTIVDYQIEPPPDGAPESHLTLWVDAAITEDMLAALLQAVVDRSVETDSYWDVRVGIAVERARISPEAGYVRGRSDHSEP
jgi:hypothetical protein